MTEYPKHSEPWAIAEVAALLAESPSWQRAATADTAEGASARILRYGWQAEQDSNGHPRPLSRPRALVTWPERAGYSTEDRRAVRGDLGARLVLERDGNWNRPVQDDAEDFSLWYANIVEDLLSLAASRRRNWLLTRLERTEAPFDSRPVGTGEYFWRVEFELGLLVVR